jgi:hypothetical protein
MTHLRQHLAVLKGVSGRLPPMTASPGCRPDAVRLRRQVQDRPRVLKLAHEMKLLEYNLLSPPFGTVKATASWEALGAWT